MTEISKHHSPNTNHEAYMIPLRSVRISWPIPGQPLR